MGEDKVRSAFRARTRRRRKSMPRCCWHCLIGAERPSNKRPPSRSLLRSFRLDPSFRPASGRRERLIPPMRGFRLAPPSFSCMCRFSQLLNVVVCPVDSLVVSSTFQCAPKILGDWNDAYGDAEHFIGEDREFLHISEFQIVICYGARTGYVAAAVLSSRPRANQIWASGSYSKGAVAAKE